MSSSNGSKPSDIQTERQAQLSHAIENASLTLLRKTLKQICQEQQLAEVIVASKLLTTEDRVRLDSDSSGDSESEDLSVTSEDLPTKAPTPKKAGSKRLRSRYALCENCEKEYDVEYNFGDSCLYHPDESYPDFDAFVDHDEDCHGIIDSEEMREEFPENFVFPCCERRGDEEPCVQDRHREIVFDVAKRLKTYK